METNKDLNELKDIFEAELREILSDYIWSENNEQARSAMCSEIQEKLFNHTITKKAKIVDKTTAEMENIHIFLFKVKDGRKEYFFTEYIKKIYKELNTDENE